MSNISMLGAKSFAYFHIHQSKHVLDTQKNGLIEAMLTNTYMIKLRNKKHNLELPLLSRGYVIMVKAK